MQLVLNCLCWRTLWLNSVDTAIRKVQSKLRNHTLRFISTSDSQITPVSSILASSLPNTARRHVNSGTLSWCGLQSHLQRQADPEGDRGDRTKEQLTFLTEDEDDDVSDDLTDMDDEEAMHSSAMARARAGTGGDYRNATGQTDEWRPLSESQPVITKTLSAAKLLRLQSRYPRIHTYVTDSVSANVGVEGQKLSAKFFPVHEKVRIVYVLGALLGMRYYALCRSIGLQQVAYVLDPNTLSMTVASASMKVRQTIRTQNEVHTGPAVEEPLSRGPVQASTRGVSGSNELEGAGDDNGLLVPSTEGFSQLASLTASGSSAVLAAGADDGMEGATPAQREDQPTLALNSPPTSGLTLASSAVVTTRPLSSQRTAMVPNTAALYFNLPSSPVPTSPVATPKKPNNANANASSSTSMAAIKDDTLPAQKHISVSLKQPAVYAQSAANSRVSRPSTASAALPSLNDSRDSIADQFTISQLNSGRDSFDSNSCNNWKSGQLPVGDGNANLVHGISTMSRVSEGNEQMVHSLAEPSNYSLEFSLSNDTAGNARAIEKLMSKVNISSPPIIHKMFNNNSHGESNNDDSNMINRITVRISDSEHSRSINDNDTSLMSVDSRTLDLDDNFHGDGVGENQSASVVVRDVNAPLVGERILKEIK
jgi:hypothetical protein